MHKNLKARKTPKVLYSFFTIQSNKITPKCQSSFVTTLDVITWNTKTLTWKTSFFSLFKTLELV